MLLSGEEDSMIGKKLANYYPDDRHAPYIFAYIGENYVLPEGILQVVRDQGLDWVMHVFIGQSVFVQ